MHDKPKLKRVYAGYYRRYDGKLIYVVQVLNDIDTGEKLVVCKDCSHSKTHNEGYYVISKASFCEEVMTQGGLVDKYIRQTQVKIKSSTIQDVTSDGFQAPTQRREKPEYKDLEQYHRCIRCSKTYQDYAKTLCVNYAADIRQHKLVKEMQAYLGFYSKDDYLAMCEDLRFLQQALKTVLHSHADFFQKRFVQGLSIRKLAETEGINRGSVERKQKQLYSDLAKLLYERDLADGICRLHQSDEE